MERILVVQTHRLGDVLHCTPAVKGIKDKYPLATISFLVDDFCKEMIDTNPFVDEIIQFPRRSAYHDLERDKGNFWQVFHDLDHFAQSLSRRGFSRIINLQNFLPSAKLVSLTENQNVTGLTLLPTGKMGSTNFWNNYFHTAVEHRRYNRFHLVDIYNLVAGVSPGYSPLIYEINAESRDRARQRLNQHELSGKTLVGIQVGASKPFRQWSPEGFSKVADTILDQMPDTRLLFFGIARERERIDSIITMMNRKQLAFNLAGETAIGELAALLARCRFLLTGDTMTLHLATAVGTPTVSLFYGPAYPVETGPYGNGHLVIHADTECSPCFNFHQCQSTECLDALSPDTIIQAITVWGILMERQPDDPEVRHATLRLPNSVGLLFSRLDPGLPCRLIPIKHPDLPPEIIAQEMMGVAYKHFLINTHGISKNDRPAPRENIVSEVFRECSELFAIPLTPEVHMIIDQEMEDLRGVGKVASEMERSLAFGKSGPSRSAAACLEKLSGFQGIGGIAVATTLKLLSRDLSPELVIEQSALLHHIKFLSRQVMDLIPLMEDLQSLLENPSSFESLDIKKDETREQLI